MTILAIDVGSSSVRAVLFAETDNGVELIEDAFVQKAYEFDTDKTGKATVSAIFLRDIIETCIDDILKHELASSISAVGMATFVGNILPIDDGHMPLADVDTYADTRSDDFVDILSAQMDTDDYHQRTGTILNSAYYLPKLKFYERQSPVIDAFTDFASYCYQHWFGSDVPMSYSVASWSGLFNRATLEWDTESLKYSQFTTENFPKLADYQQVKQGLSADYRERWQALKDVPIYLAVGDGASAQVGSGAIADKTATITVGTTSAIRKVSTETLPPVPAGAWAYRITAEHHLIGGALSEGGNIFAWARDTLNLDDVDIEMELPNRRPAEHGLTVLPLLNGERSPNWRGDARGTVHGLRLNTTALDILHAMLESVALRLAIIAEQLKLEADVKLMASGGAIHKSPAWAQIIADALGRVVHVLDEAEVTALGVAQMVWCAENGVPLQGASPKIAKVYQPNLDYTDIYTALIAKQKLLYQRTENLD